MSKKDKSKFRRRLRAEILKQMSQSQIPRSAPATSNPSISSIKPEIQEAPGTVKTQPTNIAPAITDALVLVRTDLKKSAIIISSIIILIVVLYFIDLKTGVLLKATNEIFKTLHIGT